MAAKRISKTALNWTAFAERVPKEDMVYFQALKSRTDGYVRRVSANPESLPKIDWSYYKSKIPVAGMVDTFQKSYEGLTIPYPSDQGLLGKIDEEEKKMKSDYTKLVEETNKMNAELKEKLKVLEAQIPYSEMTLEEYFLARPEVAINSANPTFFPHDERARDYVKQLKEGSQS